MMVGEESVMIGILLETRQRYENVLCIFLFLLTPFDDT